MIYEVFNTHTGYVNFTGSQIDAQAKLDRLDARVGVGHYDMRPVEHPVIKILNHNYAVSSGKWTGSLEEELTNQDLLDAEER